MKSLKTLLTFSTLLSCLFAFQLRAAGPTLCETNTGGNLDGQDNEALYQRLDYREATIPWTSAWVEKTNIWSNSHWSTNKTTGQVKKGEYYFSGSSSRGLPSETVWNEYCLVYTNPNALDNCLEEYYDEEWWTSPLLSADNYFKVGTSVGWTYDGYAHSFAGSNRGSVRCDGTSGGPWNVYIQVRIYSCTVPYPTLNGHSFEYMWENPSVTAVSGTWNLGTYQASNDGNGFYHIHVQMGIGTKIDITPNQIGQPNWIKWSVADKHFQ